ncbi:MAG: PAS domain S-box protein [Deltaproteobacteria bacterium]|jgi:two-component system sensor histidine kinase PilS (NtrC family)|nr:PAS domain S-box protein [Deltaproteobacteria bacterium]
MGLSPEKNISHSNPRILLFWYLVIRLVVVCLFLGGTIVYHLQQQQWASSPIAMYLGCLTLITILQSSVSLYLLPRLNRYRHFINAQLCWDLLFIILVIYMTGGVVSLYSFFFILIIIASSVFFPRPQVLIVACACSILYGSLLDLQYYGYLPEFRGQPLPVSLNHYDVFYAVFLHVGAFFLTALLSGALAERLKKSEEARARREIDYGELERLNQAILSNINSGLMVVNVSGRIRSFNKAASKITGYRLQEVYNRPLEAIFPEFDGVDPKSLDGVNRGEMFYRKSDAETLTLGYSATRVVDRHNESLGLLIAFQDLTGIKTLEDQLKRADRLTAVGRLASGLAHEIRNPLASISGSVQLLLEDEKVRDEDRHLMEIVIKEADRLSSLLSDFLNFARPAPLQLESIDMAVLLDELIALLGASGQFNDVTVEKAYRGPARMKVDQQKMYQVLWNLLINAGEAVQPSGRIRVEIVQGKSEIIIEDSGPGIAEEDRDKLFEPFFTTKGKGTGLGLANVYANVEAHGGHIFVEPGNLGGARFKICLSSARSS